MLLEGTWAGGWGGNPSKVTEEQSKSIWGKRVISVKEGQLRLRETFPLLYLYIYRVRNLHYIFSQGTIVLVAPQIGNKSNNKTNIVI